MAIARFWALDASIVGMEDAWNIRKGFVWWITVAWLTGRCQMVRPTEEQGPGLREGEVLKSWHPSLGSTLLRVLAVNFLFSREGGSHWIRLASRRVIDCVKVQRVRVR